jgi:hypothetical protein
MSKIGVVYSLICHIQYECIHIHASFPHDPVPGDKFCTQSEGRASAEIATMSVARREVLSGEILDAELPRDWIIRLKGEVITREMRPRRERWPWRAGNKGSKMCPPRQESSALY